MNLKELQKYSKSLRVLYVEDEAEIRKETSIFLERFFDDVVQASDGQEGLERFEKGEFDLVISDIKMPRLDGDMMLSRIRAVDPDVTLIALSGIASGHKNKKLQSDFFIRKPVVVEEFLQALTKIIEKREQ